MKKVYPPRNRLKKLTLNLATRYSTFSDPVTELRNILIKSMGIGTT